MATLVLFLKTRSCSGELHSCADNIKLIPSFPSTLLYDRFVLLSFNFHSGTIRKNVDPFSTATDGGIWRALELVRLDQVGRR